MKKKILYINILLIVLIMQAGCHGSKPALEAGDKLAEFYSTNVTAATQKGSGIHRIGDLQGKSLVYHQGASYLQLEGIPREIIEVKEIVQSSQGEQLLVKHGKMKEPTGVRPWEEGKKCW